MDFGEHHDASRNVTTGTRGVRDPSRHVPMVAKESLGPPLETSRGVFGLSAAPLDSSRWSPKHRMASVNVSGRPKDTFSCSSRNVPMDREAVGGSSGHPSPRAACDFRSVGSLPEPGRGALHPILKSHTDGGRARRRRRHALQHAADLTDQERASRWRAPVRSIRHRCVPAAPEHDRAFGPMSAPKRRARSHRSARRAGAFGCRRPIRPEALLE